MKKLIKFFAVALILCSCQKTETSRLVVESETGDIAYDVEIAATLETLERGLMHRDTLAANSGMLFDLSIVPNKVTAMWMKNTKLSLDMLFLTKEGIIFWIKEKAQPFSEELIISPFPAAAVLELNAGDVEKHKIKIGQTVKHPMFKQVNMEQENTSTITQKTDELIAETKNAISDK